MEYLHDNREIEVLDSIMGSGKTQGIIKWMVGHPNDKYLYVSPLLSEVEERIPQACESLGFISPNTNEHKTKGEHLLHLIKDGHNISFTHSLFTSLTREHLNWIDMQNYVLIIDEEIDFIEPYRGKDYHKEDILTLEKSGHIHVNEDSLGRVEWCWDEDKFVDGGNYTKLRRMCDLEMLHCAKRSREMMVLHLPISLISVCQRVLVLTYLFKGSVMSRFMDMKGITIKDFTEVALTNTEAEIRQKASDRLDIFITPTVSKLPSSFLLSYTWYSSVATPANLKQVSNAVLSGCRKGLKKDVMYTLPKDVVYESGRKSPKLRVDGYGRDDCFVYCGTRATNKYSDKTVLVHAYNRYPQQVVQAYLEDYWLPVERDTFALSELIQWVWRSNIREVDSDKLVHLCIINPRMRLLFKRWLDDGEVIL